MSQDSLEQADSEHTDVDSNDISFHTEGSLIFAEEKNPLDDLTDQQLIDHINEMETENKHLELENSLFLDFLKNNDPAAMEGLEQIINYAISLTVGPASLLPISQDTASSISTLSRRSTRLDSYTSISSLIKGKGPRINLSQKTDMIVKAMEEKQASLESFLKKSHRIRRNLKSELEEFSLRESDIREAKNIFEFNVVTQGVDPLTQRIPAEKFLRYMEDWLKSAQFNIEKLRLRTASLKVQYKKVSATLIQRQELGENVHAVDFDQLQIENKHFLEKIDQKQTHLIELKRMNGGANLVLSKHKKYLQKQQEDYNKLKDSVSQQEKEIEDLEKEYEKVELELDRAKDKFEYYKNLKGTYKVPDVMEYVNLKNELSELKKSIKIWQRRKKIQDIALNACIREMKNITGASKVDPTWFEDLDPDSNYEIDV